MSDGQFTKRVFSGIKPSGGMTLGNYLGAIKRWVQMQNEDYETVYCVVDLHAITVWQEPGELARSTHEVAAAMIASGIDPEKSILFNQSQVPAHTELAWLFNMNRGIFMTPGREEEWTLSVTHTDEAIDRYVEVFEEMAFELTRP